MNPSANNRMSLTSVYNGGFYPLTKGGRLVVEYNENSGLYSATLKNVSVIVGGETYFLKGQGKTKRLAILSLADQYHTAKSLDGLFLM
jgi:hypothetical protein